MAEAKSPSLTISPLSVYRGTRGVGLPFRGFQNNLNVLPVGTD